MRLVKWEELPASMQNEAVKKYYGVLEKKRISLFFKRVFDIAASLLGIVLLSPAYLVLAIAIKLDSPGPVFFRQERVTQYGRPYHIRRQYRIPAFPPFLLQSESSHSYSSRQQHLLQYLQPLTVQFYRLQYSQERIMV